MKRSLVTLASLIAWVALCLPWQICQSDCRTALVGGWGHDCHLHAAHAGGDTSPSGLGGHGHGHGAHSKLQVPLSEPEAPPALGNQPSPTSFTPCLPAELEGLPRRILARCTGPPGSWESTLPKRRSVVLLL